VPENIAEPRVGCPRAAMARWFAAAESLAFLHTNAPGWGDLVCVLADLTEVASLDYPGRTNDVLYTPDQMEDTEDVGGGLYGIVVGLRDDDGEALVRIRTLAADGMAGVAPGRVPPPGEHRGNIERELFPHRGVTGATRGTLPGPHTPNLRGAEFELLVREVEIVGRYGDVSPRDVQAVYEMNAPPCELLPPLQQGRARGLARRVLHCAPPVRRCAPRSRRTSATQRSCAAGAGTLTSRRTRTAGACGGSTVASSSRPSRCRTPRSRASTTAWAR
jgi:hypothetical protein